MSSKSGGELVTGHVALLFPSQYIKAADLHGRNVTVTIDRLVREKVTMEGGKSEKKIVVRMLYPNGNPIEKGWILNKTNSKLISAVLGVNEVEKWSGRKITLFPTTCKGAQGGIVECIRVRGRVDEGANAASIPEGMAAKPEAHEQAREPGSDG